MRLEFADELWPNILSTKKAFVNLPPALQFAVDKFDAGFRLSAQTQWVAEWCILEKPGDKCSLLPLDLPGEFAGRENFVRQVVDGWGKDDVKVVSLDGLPGGWYALSSQDGGSKSTQQVIAFVPVGSNGTIFISERRRKLTSTGCAVVFAAALSKCACQFLQVNPAVAKDVLGEETVAFYRRRLWEEVFSGEQPIPRDGLQISANGNDVNQRAG